ncbi:MAG: 50S ribosomal protein L30 [Candidatus Rokuibacteriota bacterium]|nr:MAG: 50S ribosomal protein L30 [Candidatus Rokubacteria bacterium]
MRSGRSPRRRWRRGPLPSSRKLRVTLTRSLIGLKPNHVRTLNALGLRRIRASVVHDDTPAIRGMIDRVPYAVRVEETSA